MTATVNGSGLPDFELLLRRDDERRALDERDETTPREIIARLAKTVERAVEQHLAERDAAVDTGAAAELASLRQRFSDVQDEHAKAYHSWARQSKRLTGELETARQELADELADVKAERDQARAELAQARKAAEQHGTDHRHFYELPTPDSVPGPCVICDRPFPWIAVVEEDIEPTAPEPWADLFARIRADCSGWTGAAS